MKLWNVIIALLFLSACSPNNVTVDNSLKKYFDDNKVNGTFALFNNGQSDFTIYNLHRYRDSSFLPASTFKIVNSLIGLETGKISNEKMLLKWDGVQRRIADWNQDLTMEQAFKYSAVWYYQEIARRIGKDTMQFWLDSLHYGTQKIKGPIDSFWLNNSLKIKPDEQLGLVKKLYFDQLPFQKRTQEIVRKVMVQESTANYILAYKTGWGFDEKGDAIGWIVGWVEENRHPYFFVLNVQGPKETDMTTVRMNILKGILKQLGFFEGRK